MLQQNTCINSSLIECNANTTLLSDKLTTCQAAFPIKTFDGFVTQMGMFDITGIPFPTFRLLLPATFLFYSYDTACLGKIGPQLVLSTSGITYGLTTSLTLLSTTYYDLIANNNYFEVWDTDKKTKVWSATPTAFKISDIVSVWTVCKIAYMIKK